MRKENNFWDKGFAVMKKGVGVNFIRYWQLLEWWKNVREENVT